MKRYFKYFVALACVFTFVNCDSDLDKTTYNEDNATALQLGQLDANYTLTASSESDTALVFKWTNPDFGYIAAYTNTLEIDLAGKNFASAYTVTSIGTNEEYSITHGDINAAIISLLGNYEMTVTEEATDFEFRVLSSISSSIAPLVSNVAKTTITPYSGEREYPMLYIRGDYNSWGENPVMKLYSENSDDTYTGMVAFDGKAVNGWKLCEDLTWTVSWGTAGEAPSPSETSPLVLSGTDNIKDYAKSYYSFSFDKSSLTLSITSSQDSWGIVGDFNDWGGSADKTMTLISEDNGTGKIVYYLTADVDLVAGEGWKLRADSDWGTNYGPGSFAEEPAANDGGNYTVSASGNYTIKWYFNQVNKKLVATLNP